MTFQTGCSDPLGWATFPRSAIAFEHVKDVAKRDSGFSAIVEKHIADGICTAEGKLLKRWDCGVWVAA
jgi:hypothetical protein